MKTNVLLPISRPKRKELPLTVALTGWLYQPLESTERERTTDTFGVDVSTWSGSLVLVWPDGRPPQPPPGPAPSAPSRY